MSKARTLVVGSGPIGSYLAARLAESGEDVTLHGLGTGFIALAETGVIRLGSIDNSASTRTIQLQCVVEPPQPGNWDVVIFAVKAQDLGIASRQFRAHVRNATVVLPQNGLPWWQFLGDWAAPAAWSEAARSRKAGWIAAAARYTDATNAEHPSDAQVIGAVQRRTRPSDIVVCAAGGLPGELHKLWNSVEPLGYHAEYGYSTMGYEIAGALGVKLAHPAREVFVMIGDGSYLMMNSELATSVMLGLKLTLVLLDNGGFGCINRLQQATGGAPFNNLLADSRHVTLPRIDFVAHASSLGAEAVKVHGIADLEHALEEARAKTITQVILIETDAGPSTDAGGHWWDVAVPEVSVRPTVETARALYETARQGQRSPG